MEFLHLEIIEKTTPLQSSLVMNILPKRMSSELFQRTFTCLKSAMETLFKDMK